MDQQSKTAIFSLDDGTVSGFRDRYRYTRLATKRRAYKRVVAYLPDGTMRRVLGYRDVRREFYLSDLVFWNPMYNAIPIFSEPIGTYEFRDLKLLVAKHVHRLRHSMIGGDVELRLRLEHAETFDDLLDIVYPEPKLVAEYNGP